MSSTLLRYRCVSETKSLPFSSKSMATGFASMGSAAQRLALKPWGSENRCSASRASSEAGSTTGSGRRSKGSSSNVWAQTAPMLAIQKTAIREIRKEGFMGSVVVLVSVGAGESYMDESHLPARRSAGFTGVYGKLPVVRPIRPGNKVFIPLFVVAVALMVTWNSRRDSGKAPGAPADSAARAESAAPMQTAAPGSKQAPFDFYLLALTAHAAFCADGNARKAECRAGSSTPISIHGLWPERFEPGKYPRDCPGPPLSLRPDSEARLATLMPGMADGLHEHEWRRHGTCTGLDDDIYFGHTYVLSLQVVT